VFIAFFAIVAEVHEYGDARGDHEYDEIFMGCEATSVEYDIHDHHWDEFAGLAEDHRGVGDVRERGEAEGCGRGNKSGALQIPK